MSAIVIVGAIIGLTAFLLVLVARKRGSIRLANLSIAMAMLSVLLIAIWFLTG